MFKQHETIFYNNNGICEIIDISDKTISNIKKTYYILQPLNNPRSLIYIPCDNNFLVSQMKKVLSKDEVKELIETLPKQPLIWIEDRNKRKEVFQEILRKGNCLEIAVVLKSIYYNKIELASQKKKISSFDNTLYHDIEKILVETFAYILEIDKDEVISLIFKQEN